MKAKGEKTELFWLMGLLLVIWGSASVYAEDGLDQTTPPGAVPLPPLPQITLTMPPRGGGYSVEVTSAELWRLFEIRDQRNYLQYLRNSGYITEDEYKRRDLPLEQAEADIFLPIVQADQFAYIYANEYIKGEISKLWPGWSPGWPGREIRQTSGLNLQQPQGTRSSFSFNLQMIRGSFTPYSEEAYNNIKQQLEAALGAPLELNRDFARDPVNNWEYQYVLRLNRSAIGRPYLIELTRYTSSNRIYLEVSELTRDL